MDETRIPTDGTADGPPDLNEILAEAPLLSALFRHSGQRRSRWHMPAHLGGAAFPAALARSLAALDLTELPQLDDLNAPGGAALRAMELAADAFSSGLTRFVCAGATAALHLLLSVAVGRQGCLLAAPGCHRAVLYATAKLDLEVHWIRSEGCAPWPSMPAPDEVADGLARLPSCRAVLIVSPDYYGRCADLTAIAAVCRDAGALLLVDEAHGAHLAFGKGLLPATALSCGAAAVVQSGHKTLPVLTPGALLHVSARALSDGSIPASRLDRQLPVWQTSSPPMGVAATLDYARVAMVRYGGRRIEALLRAVRELNASLSRDAPGICLENLAPDHRRDAQDDESGVDQRFRSERLPARDPLRLVLRAADPDLAGWAAAIEPDLRRRGIDIEFADLTRLVLIPSLWQPSEDWSLLAGELIGLTRCWMDRTSACDRRRDAVRRLTLEKDWQTYQPADREQVIAPSEALFGNRQTRRVALSDAAGAIVADDLTPYPPGIPLIWPGQRMNARLLDLIRRIIDNGWAVHGVVEKTIAVFEGSAVSGGYRGV